ncbi:MAG TPA: hypothetical protein VGD65_24715 [Chryseosolibacter sp.]
MEQESKNPLSIFVEWLRYMDDNCHTETIAFLILLYSPGYTKQKSSRSVRNYVDELDEYIKTIKEPFKIFGYILFLENFIDFYFYVINPTDVDAMLDNIGFNLWLNKKYSDEGAETIFKKHADQGPEKHRELVSFRNEWDRFLEGENYRTVKILYYSRVVMKVQ